MPQVETALGAIDVEDIGMCLMHEHIIIADWDMRSNYDDYVDIESEVPKAVGSLNKAKERGVKTIVDLTPVNLGRDIHSIKAVSKATGVNVICPTGFYWTEEPWMHGWDADYLSKYMIRDVTQGILDTGIKAGIIKCATDHTGVDDFNKKLLQASAIAHRETGTPISTHTTIANSSAIDQVSTFQEFGVDMSRVVIGHLGDSTDIDYLESILASGCFIGMDRFGLEAMLPSDDRIRTVATLCDKGYAGQMVISHDACSFQDFFDGEYIEKFAPNWCYEHVPRDVLPALAEAGVSQADINMMMVGNPKKVFSTSGSY
ncbi:MAG: phosphotriesterase-related protein [Cellvibrionales bacterium]|nr:MAG: phosphotriesterase-related protein [Cellvibrionales bacterium]